MDLIAAPAENAWAAIGVELSRVLGDEPIDSAVVDCPDLEHALALPSDYTNVPTHFTVIPTRSKWSVLRVNSSLCDGYDSLSHCITANHGFTTLHWSAHDTTTTFQPGAGFTFRRMTPNGIEKRSVQTAENDGRWTFVQVGAPLHEEDTSLYTLRSRRARLNESSLLALLARFDAYPWSEEFYALPGKCYVHRRTAAPDSIVRRSPISLASV